ncbi:MAG: transglutaminase-like cysteine peptidase [Hyphomicrobiaceae bacterium]
MSITHDPLRARLERWAELVALGRACDLSETVHVNRLLGEVNVFFNGARYESDGLGCDEVDHWATPREFITRDAGDCEDFAIAKYFTLRAAGIDRRRLRLLYAKVLPGRIPHMVLAYSATPGTNPLILDNLTSQIKPLSERDDLDPVYAFNEARVWLFRDSRTPIDVCAAGTLVLWRKLLERVAQENQPVEAST